MRWNHSLSILLLLACFLSMSTVIADMPTITGKPVVDLPKLLAWPQYGSAVKPDITEPTANTLNDLTGNIRDCDIMLSTAGNYHMALTELWPSYLAMFPESDRPRNWFNDL